MCCALQLHNRGKNTDVAGLWEKRLSASAFFFLCVCLCVLSCSHHPSTVHSMIKRFSHLAAVTLSIFFEVYQHISNQ